MYQEEPLQLKSRVIKAKFFESLGYSTVWEDERAIEKGLEPAPGERVFGISSGGCFSLQFLLYDVAEVISIDFNRRQNDLLALKALAASSLGHDDLWKFLGLSPCDYRQEIYSSLREKLNASSRKRFDENPQWIKEGISLVGRQDRYLHGVGNLVEKVQGKRRVKELLMHTDPEEHKVFFRREWDRKRWKLFCGLVFNRLVLHRAFDREHFLHSQEKNPAWRLSAEIKRCLLNTPGGKNFYLHYLFCRTYPSKEDCPAWLRASSFDMIRERINRLKIETAELEEFFSRLPSDYIDCFNFSNAFDWISTENFVHLMREVLRVAKDGARLCYWTNAVNTRRELSWTGCPQFRLREDIGDEISLFSRTPGYSGCTVARIEKGRKKVR